MTFLFFSDSPQTPIDNGSRLGVNKMTTGVVDDEAPSSTVADIPN